jgi:hypothetical protein
MLVGLRYMTVNFWKDSEILALFDCDRNIQEQQEPIHSSNVSLPGQQDVEVR